MLYWVLYLENEENKIVFITIVITRKTINLWLHFKVTEDLTVGGGWRTSGSNLLLLQGIPESTDIFLHLFKCKLIFS